jgi:transposase
MKDPNWQSTSKFILLPELKIISHWQSHKFRTRYKCAKESDFEVCPKCAVKSYSVHDRRWVKVQDAPIRGSGVVLHILKRRFRCPSCKKVFTEPVPLSASDEGLNGPAKTLPILIALKRPMVAPLA